MTDTMSEQVECGWVREALPDLVTGRAPDAERIERHVAACAECRAELDLVRLLHASRADVGEMSESMLERIIHEARRRAPARTGWALSAAAIAALALGLGIVSNGTPTEIPVREAEEGELWVSDDGLVAGAPALDRLSDEALLRLLDELTNVSTGGAA